MVIKREQLEFQHLVRFKERATFAAAKEGTNGSSRIRLFLIFGGTAPEGRRTGCVYGRNGTLELWEELSSSDADYIRTKASAAVDQGLPVFTTNDSAPLN